MHHNDYLRQTTSSRKGIEKSWGGTEILLFFSNGWGKKILSFYLLSDDSRISEQEEGVKSLSGSMHVL